MKDEIICKDPRIQGATPVFAGSRVAVKNLFDYLETGETLNRFFHDFPLVDRANAIAALEMAQGALYANAHPAR